MKSHKNLYLSVALWGAGLIFAVALVLASFSLSGRHLSGRHVIGEMPMDDGRVIRVVQNRLGILRTLVGDCVTMIEVELASGGVRTATLSLDDSIRGEIQLSKVGADAIIDWYGSPLTVDPKAMYLFESNGEIFQPFDGVKRPWGM